MPNKDNDLMTSNSRKTEQATNRGPLPNAIGPREISVVVADDHPIFRRGLRMVIESDPELKVVAEADDGIGALARIAELDPDVAVLDIDMPGQDGLQVARTLRSNNSRTRSIFLTMHKDEGIFNAAIEADVPGFVIKDSAATEIVTCIRSVVDGHSFVSSALSEMLMQRRRTEKVWWEDLTAAERRVLRLIAAEKTSREIADELFLSRRTVEHHRARIAGKLDLKGKNGLLTYALLHKAEILRS